uniref:hypothetical protein n=1 Tax=Microcoleus sp. TaxID=44472 RepID=UPI00403E368E
GMGASPMPYALCPMPYALCPMPYEHLMLLRKAIVCPLFITQLISFDLVYFFSNSETVLNA